MADGAHYGQFAGGDGTGDGLGGVVREGEEETWGVRVDARTGEVLSFEDENRYADVRVAGETIGEGTDSLKDGFLKTFF